MGIGEKIRKSIEKFPPKSWDAEEEKQKKEKEAASKIIQYVMVAALLAMAFVLPKFGAEKTAESFGDGRTIQNHGTDQIPESGVSAEGAADQAGVIVLDAGHGGDDPGMTGSSGITEKVLNLIYAKKLEALLTEAGYQVIQTRPTEEGLYQPGDSNKKARDMQKRVSIISEAKPLLTISIHQNSYPADNSVCGPQVFYYEHSAEGEKLASCIQESLNTELSVARPRVHKGNTSYYILKRSASTTVIVECGFLTNPEEEAKLQEEAYQDQVVQAIFDGAMKYLAEAA